MKRKRRTAKLSSTFHVTHVRRNAPLPPTLMPNDAVQLTISLDTTGFLLQDEHCREVLRWHFHRELDRTLDELMLVAPWPFDGEYEMDTVRKP